MSRPTSASFKLRSTGRHAPSSGSTWATLVSLSSLSFAILPIRRVEKFEKCCACRSISLLQRRITFDSTFDAFEIATKSKVWPEKLKSRLASGTLCLVRRFVSAKKANILLVSKFEHANCRTKLVFAIAVCQFILTFSLPGPPSLSSPLLLGSNSLFPVIYFTRLMLFCFISLRFLHTHTQTYIYICICIHFGAM